MTLGVTPVFLATLSFTFSFIFLPTIPIFSRVLSLSFLILDIPVIGPALNAPATKPPAAESTTPSPKSCSGFTVALVPTLDANCPPASCNVSSTPSFRVSFPVLRIALCPTFSAILSNTGDLSLNRLPSILAAPVSLETVPPINPANPVVINPASLANCLLAFVCASGSSGFEPSNSAYLGEDSIKSS